MESQRSVPVDVQVPLKPAVRRLLVFPASRQPSEFTRKPPRHRRRERPSGRKQRQSRVALCQQHSSRYTLYIELCKMLQSVKIYIYIMYIFISPVSEGQEREEESQTRLFCTCRWNSGEKFCSFCRKQVFCLFPSILHPQAFNLQKIK